MELNEHAGSSVTIANGALDSMSSRTNIAGNSSKHEKERQSNGEVTASKGGGHIQTDHPTSYAETLMHLLRGNIGAGVFGMGDAFKNGGLILSGFLTIALGITCIHAQHILLNCSRKMREKEEKTATEDDPDFAETVELCIANGPPRIRKWSKTIRLLVNIFICVTQIGFCCVYFVFISTNFKQIWKYIYDTELSFGDRILLILLPIILTSLITNLKYLAPCSTIANITMGTGIALTYYYALQDVPSPSERRYFGNINDLPLYFGTAVYAFEGIALVLPLKNSMKKPQRFDSVGGVLNFGMVFVMILFTTFGFCGYLKWGESVAGSLTLNLPHDDPFAQFVKGMVSIGMLLTFPLQFFVAIQIMWSAIQEKHGPLKNALPLELVFRTVMVLLTFAISELVPRLNLFISLIGALCSTTLALVFPPVIELACTWGTSKGPTPFLLLKNFFILTVAVFGIVSGTYESVWALAESFLHQ